MAVDHHLAAKCRTKIAIYWHREWKSSFLFCVMNESIIFSHCWHRSLLHFQCHQMPTDSIRICNIIRLALPTDEWMDACGANQLGINWSRSFRVHCQKYWGEEKKRKERNREKDKKLFCGTCCELREKKGRQRQPHVKSCCYIAVFRVIIDEKWIRI